MTGNDQTRLDRHFENLRSTTLADLRALADAGGGLGVFLLAAPIIDALASASATDRYRWKQYTEAYMPRLATLAPLLWDEFRNPGSRALSASSRFRFASGDDQRWAHTLPGSDEAGRSVWYLHTTELVADVETGFERIWQATRVDDSLRARMLTRFDREPPIGPAPELKSLDGSVAAAGAASASNSGWRIRHLRTRQSR